MNNIMKLCVLVLCCVVYLAGCASSPPPKSTKEPTDLTLEFKADKNANLDTKFRPSPILIKVYELKNPAVFEQADFFSLHEKEKIILAEDLLSKEEFILRPGEEKKIEKESNPETKALGLIAGYQELGRSIWRVVFTLPEAKEKAWYRMVIPNNSVDLEIQLKDYEMVLKKKE